MTKVNTKASRRFPAEWEPSDAVLIAWPHADTDWAPMLEEVTATYIDLVKAILPSARVVIVTPEPDHVKSLIAHLDPMGQRIIYVTIHTNDTWARDFGPITVLDSDSKPLPLDFTFNGWGLKYAADLDNLITSRLDQKGLFSQHTENRRDMVLEGGSIESDGHGTILTTSQCLLSPNRNPWLTKDEIQSRLLGAFGANRILWLDHGHLEGDDTDSHTDTLARLAPNDTIIYVAPPEDESDPHHSDLVAMQEQLKTFRTAKGQPYNLIALPFADPVYEGEERHPATYANYLVINDAVLMPTYGSARKDHLAAQMLRIAFPDHEIRPIDCQPLIKQHGSLHCITMQLPAGTLSF